ncbi:MAG: lipoyl(octanoyl) transferase LipB [Fimbriimonas sp.]
MRPFDVVDLGRMGYESCRDLQADLLEKVADGTAPDTLLLVEHDPVLTLGANFHAENLLYPQESYAERGTDVFRTERGGDVTYHGPGQLVIYPVFDVAQRGRDLHVWLRSLEEVTMQAVASFGLQPRRFPPHTGVWIEDRKVAAIGIRVRRWVSMHGIALNCDLDLAPFESIVPCGIQGYGVTSLTLETGRPVSVEEAKSEVIRAFSANP